ncbi:MAG: carbon monoxide dehydrogenase [Saprospiraceae bacterium]|nr:MAG: carbon monoxide dehydrogenase [Saprospiraceae bacterium]
MIPAEFSYHRPSTLDEVISLLSEHGDDAKLLSGGHSLIPAMKMRLNQPGMLIDIGRLSELNGIKKEGDELVIGANSTHASIAHSETIKEHLPIMAEAADLIGDVQVRNRGTIGGSLAHADPSADWPAVMIATNAKIVVKGSKGERSITAEDFFMGFYMTALEETEIITHIKVPVAGKNTKTSYQKFMQPASRFAIVGCAAVVTIKDGKCEDARIAFTGVSDAPFRDTGVEDAIRSKALNTENIEAAATKAAAGQDIVSDHFASEEYRLHLAKVYVRKALSAVAE